MRQRTLAAFFAAVLLALFSVSALAADNPKDDTDTRFVDAKVVEVADGHISVVARSGVEHVIAIDSANTKVTMNEQVVSLKDLREGDVITVELDAKKQVKFAKNISMNSEQIQVARNRR